MDPEKKCLNGLFSLLNFSNPKKLKPFSQDGQVSYLQAFSSIPGGGFLAGCLQDWFPQGHGTHVAPGVNAQLQNTGLFTETAHFRHQCLTKGEKNGWSRVMK